MEQKENLEKKNKLILGGVIMDKVCVIGLGSWGSALALTLCKNGYEVHMWTRNESQANEINTTRVNSRFLPGVIFPKEMRIFQC